MTTLPVLAAYGRTYKDDTDAIIDWQAGRDWRIYDGPYLSIRDTPKLRDMGFDFVQLHWHADGKLRSVPVLLGGIRKASDPLAQLGD